MNQKPPVFEPALPVGDELDRAGALVADGFCRRDRGSAHGGAQGRAHAGRRRLLDDFLVAALQRAVALTQMDGVAVAVGEDLQLDVARMADIFFDQHAGVAKGRLRLALRRFQRGVEIGMLVDTPHALAAAAGSRLDQQRVAELIGLLLEEFRLLPLAVIAGHHRHAGFFHQRLGAIFQPHGADRGRRRADEGNAGGQAGLREIGVLGEEAVTGMHAVGAGRLRRGDQPGAREVTLRRRRRPDVNRLVGQPHMQRVAVGVGIDRDRAQAHAPGGADDAAGDLAAIGDEDGFEHRRSRSRRY